MIMKLFSFSGIFSKVFSLVSGWKLYLGIAAITAVVLGFIVNKAYNAGEDKANAQWLEKELKRTKQHDEQIRKQQEELSKLNANLETALKNTKTIIREVEKKVNVEVEKPIYINCKMPETGTEIANEVVKKLNNERKK